VSLSIDRRYSHLISHPFSPSIHATPPHTLSLLTISLSQKLSRDLNSDAKVLVISSGFVGSELVYAMTSVYQVGFNKRKFCVKVAPSQSYYHVFQQISKF